MKNRNRTDGKTNPGDALCLLRGVDSAAEVSRHIDDGLATIAKRRERRLRSCEQREIRKEAKRYVAALLAGYGAQSSVHGYDIDVGAVTDADERIRSHILSAFDLNPKNAAAGFPSRTLAKSVREAAQAAKISKKESEILLSAVKQAARNFALSGRIKQAGGKPGGRGGTSTENKAPRNKRRLHRGPENIEDAERKSIPERIRSATNRLLRKPKTPIVSVAANTSFEDEWKAYKGALNRICANAGNYLTEYLLALVSRTKQTKDEERLYMWMAQLGVEPPEIIQALFADSLEWIVTPRSK